MRWCCVLLLLDCLPVLWGLFYCFLFSGFRPLPGSTSTQREGKPYQQLRFPINSMLKKYDDGSGDIVRVASLVVWAIRDGREAADAILDELNAAAPVAAE